VDKTACKLKSSRLVDLLGLAKKKKKGDYGKNQSVSQFMSRSLTRV
jgi:hypothetical protein